MKKPAFNFFLGILMSFLSLSLAAQPGGGFGGDCDCNPEDETPVCVVDEEGNVFELPGACFAECLGLTVLPEEECTVFGGGNGGGNLCDCDPLNPGEPVCAIDDMGNLFILPECFAVCEGFEIIGDGDCELGGGGNGGGNGGGEFPCDCDPNVFEPVCVIDGEGAIFELPNACLAECLGLELANVEDCELGGGGNGGGNGGGEFPCDDCDPLNPGEPVCAVDEMGNVIILPECFAICEGFEIVGDGDCELGGGGNGGGEFPCDCDPNVFEPVCVVDEEGNIFEFPNACFAECFGLQIADVEDCGYGGGNGGGEFPCDDCDPLNPGEPVCAVDQMGNVIILPECFAVCEGFEIIGDGDCELGGGGNGGGEFPCDCDPNVFEPVCVIDGEGAIFELPNACLAECLGLELANDEDCDFGGGNGGFPCEDCDPLNPGEPVCAVDEMGNVIILPECIAVCEGFEIIGDGNCELGGGGNGGGEFPCDCDPNVFEPVCVIDGEGAIFELPNACLAECLGLELANDEDCGFGGGNGGFPCEDCDPLNPGEMVCAMDDMGNIFVLSLCLAECEGFEIVGDGACDLGEGDNPGGLPGGCFEWDEEEFAGLAPAQGGNTGPDGTGNDFDGMATLSGLTTYPNPVQNSLNIAISSSVETKAFVELLNMTGKVMLSQQSIVQKGDQLIEFNTAELVPGMYLIRITPENGSPVTEKVIKN